jgi:nickel-type superoxide dismutase maturation protease
MAPTLRHGDQLLVRLTGGGSIPTAGRLVVVRLPDGTLAVKRLVRLNDDGTVWIEGDNPFGSTDSRALGPLPAGAVVGRVLLRLWPRPGHVSRSP